MDNASLLNGIKGGIMAGIIKDIPDVIFHYWLKLTKIDFLDYSGAVAFGRLPHGTHEHVYCFLLEILFSLLLGMLFVFFLKEKVLPFNCFIILGAIYGAAIWFMIMSVILVFQISFLMPTDLTTSAIHWLNSMLYGIVLSSTINCLHQDKR